MSEIWKNADDENEKNVTFSKSSKQKHNSKRRKPKKHKVLNEVCNGFDTGNVDQVVNYLCSTLRNFDSENFSGSRCPINVPKEGPKIVGVNKGQIYDQNSELYKIQKPLSSSKDLSSLFESLKINESHVPIQSNNITDLSSKTPYESLSAKEKLKQKKSKKNPKKTCVPSEGLTDFVNLGMFENSSGTSVPIQKDSMLLVSEVEQSFYSDLPNGEEKSQNTKCLNKCFGADGLMTEENSFAVPVKLTQNSTVRESEKSLLKNKSQKNNGKFQKKKVKNKKNDEHDEKNSSNWNQRVFLNSYIQQKSCSESESPESKQSNVSKKKNLSTKSSHAEKETEFPKYLSSEELQSLSNFGVLLTGIIRINQKNYKEAYIVAPDKGMDILIEGLKDRNRALEGDEVYFVLKPKELHRVNTDCPGVQKTAVVVGIKTFNHNRGAIGTLNPVKRDNNYALFSPRDSRLPRIRIKKSNWPKGFSDNSGEFKDKLYFVKISKWNNVRFADGDIIKEVGPVGDLVTETDAILLKYGLDVKPYSEDLIKCIPSSNFKISEFDLMNREDFRKDCIFTIDPETAVDLDDALSCKLLPNGNFEIGVHIADVSYFLEEETPLDKIVGERATTVYLVHKAYHMLPLELCGLCSLSPGKDKLSFSVLWEVTPDWRIISHRFTRGVLNSCAQFSYSQIQAIIDNVPTVDSTLPKIHGGHKIENIKKNITILHKLAVHLRKKRFSDGALRIDKKKIRFFLDENNLPTDFKEEIQGPSHKLIEEFMLLANIAVAEELSAKFPQLAFLRSHPPPLPYILDKLKKNLEKYGIILDISSSGTIQASILKYSGNDTESCARMLVLNNALAKPMSRAKYYCGGLFLEKSDRRHYALNVPLYTHFTSPIRRYADIMVHRLLAASLNYCDSPKWSPEFVQLIASNCNKQKYAAKMAQEMSVELFFTFYIELKGSVVCKAVVCDIKDKSFDCIGLSTGIHSRIYFETIEGEFKREKEDGIFRLTIKWPKNETHDKEKFQIIEMFNIVTIELKRASVLKIEAKLLRNQ